MGLRSKRGSGRTVRRDLFAYTYGAVGGVSISAATLMHGNIADRDDEGVVTDDGIRHDETGRR